MPHNNTLMSAATARRQPLQLPPVKASPLQEVLRVPRRIKAYQNLSVTVHGETSAAHCGLLHRVQCCI